MKNSFPLGTSRLLIPVLCAGLWSSCVLPIEHTSTATPQRPTFSTNTQTTAAHTVEVEAGLRVDPSDALTVPVTAKVGVDHSSEVYMAFDPLRWIDTPGKDQAGIGDLSFGYRHRFREETDERSAMAFQLEAKIPTADAEKGLGTGETDLFAALAAERQLRRVRLNGYYRLGLLGEVDNGTVDMQHAFAVVASRPIERQLTAFGEGVYVWTPEQDNEQLFTTLGVSYAATPSLVFDASVVVGLTPDAPDLVFLVGLTQNGGRRHHGAAAGE